MKNKKLWCSFGALAVVVLLLEGVAGLKMLVFIVLLVAFFIG